MVNLSPDAKFKVTVAAAGCVVTGAFIFGWRAQATLTSLLDEVKKTVYRLDNVESKLNERINGFEAVVSDRFTKTAAAEWALRFQILNPGIPVPDPRNPMLLLGMKPPGEMPQNTRADWRP